MCSRSWKTWVNWTTPLSSLPRITGPRRSASPMAASPLSKGRKARPGKAATVALVVRWPGHIKPGTVKKQMFAALDWLPTLVDIAGGPKGDDLNKQIQAGKYPASPKPCSMASTSAPISKARRSNQRVMSSSTTRARRHRRCATRIGRCITRWRLGAPGWFLPLVNYHWTLVGNVKRDPFEQTISFSDSKSAMALGGALGSPNTAYLYAWNMLPIGQLLWDEGTLHIQGLSATASAGNLQPERHPEANGKQQGR